jgi:hypothetical protein
MVFGVYGPRKICADAKLSLGVCNRYADPELAVGCADGSMRVYDLYSGCCSRLFRLQNFLLLHGQLPVTFKEQSEYYNV